MTAPTRLGLLASTLFIFLLTAGSGYLFLMERNALKQENIQLDQTLQKTTQENKILQKDIQGLNAELTDIEDAYLRLDQELTGIIQDRDVLGLQIETLTRNNNELNQKLEEVKKALTQALGEKSELTKRLDEIERKGGVRLPPIVVRPEKSQDETTQKIEMPVQEVPLTARVIAVNKKHRFIVINSGSKDGIKTDMDFLILDKKERQIGKAQVVEARDHVAALSIVQLARKKKVKKGFFVVQEKQPY